jgi:poly(3-hydroxybutyrate) depolymerase
MGFKAADCVDTACGAWLYTRDYYVNLPPGYDRSKAYPLVFEGPGCGGGGNNLYNNPMLSSLAIRVGLSPPPNSIGHGTNPNQGCFDDIEGDDSVDWVFYETLYDRLANELCFDRNRVFAGGDSSGARMANELGCKYAGDALRPIRGVMTHGAGLPLDRKHWPTCSSKPMAGFWVGQVSRQVPPFAEIRMAVTRAMNVNGCSGTTYEDAQLEPFTIGTDSTSCKKVVGCPSLFPLVVCALPYANLTDDSSVVNPGSVAFLKLF